jgi:O-succinylbenzoic acid--CoA ligase
VILSGGKKIFPEQLEARTAALLPFPHYFTAASDERLGQAVVLVLETDRPSEEVVPEVMSALVTVLDKHELPRRVRTVPSFDRTSSGKVVSKE